MYRKIGALAAILATCVAVTVVAQQLPPSDDWRAAGRYLPEYTTDDQLVPTLPLESPNQ